MNDLLILAFDHRGTFLEKLFGAKGRKATSEEAVQIKQFKKIIFDGFLKALNERVPRELAGMLVDEEFGADILLEAKKLGVTFAMPVEKSGQEEFDFDYGDWQEHIEIFSPIYTKVLVRYNPDGDGEMNKQQLQRLKILHHYLMQKRRKFLFELLVPATAGQLALFGGSKDKYDVMMRPGLMKKAMSELQMAGVLPELWKLEGVEKKEDAEMLVWQARAVAKKAGIITLGRGESIDKVREWLKVGAHVDGVVGFAVGRTIFYDAIEKFHKKQITREEAVACIAKNYADFVELWTRERK